jgi:hypothetical protein
MTNQQKKIEEQRTIIQHLRQRLEREENSVKISQIAANSWVPSIHNKNLKSEETIVATHGSDNMSTKEESDSAINTDSGSECGRLYEADFTLIGAKYSNLEEIKLSRSLSDLHMCKHMREKYLRKRHPRIVYPNHRSVQRPRDVKKRHWRKSALGIETHSEEIFRQ